MSGSRTAATGRWGEDAALDYLESRGLTLLHRNFRRRFGEIDLVMQQRDCIVFVEVRVRRHPSFGDGLTSITYRKRQRLRRAAAAYLKTHSDLASNPCRFDVVSVTAAGTSAVCAWTVDAFSAG